jgi:hypothetical protein
VTRILIVAFASNIGASLGFYVGLSLVFQKATN